LRFDVSKSHPFSFVGRNFEMIESELIPLSALVRRKIGRSVSPCALWRWHAKGLSNGARLQVARCGRGLYCTEEWFDEFLRQQNEPMPSAAPAVPVATVAELQAAGLLSGGASE
jgi:hypothetical protein